MMKAIIAGHDPEDIAEAFAEADVSVARAEGTADREALEAAGAADADFLVITDVGLATAIPVTKEMNPDIRVVVYDRQSLPDFARGQADLIIDPDLMDPETVVGGLV